MDIGEALRWVGSASVVSVSVFALLRCYLKTYVEPRVKSAAEAAGKLSAEKELEAHRGETAKLVESHKAELAAQADEVRAHFQKQLTDYAIYVQRRHDAVRDLYTAVVMSKALAYGFGDTHADEADHFQRLALRARDAVYALAGAYQLNVLYLPDAVYDQYMVVQSAFTEVLVMRENRHPSLSVRPALDRLEDCINILAAICRKELQSSA
jgi:hypothetical protein